MSMREGVQERMCGMRILRDVRYERRPPAANEGYAH